MKNLIKLLSTIFNECPSGGSHNRGTSGEWIGRCTKCGNPC